VEHGLSEIIPDKNIETFQFSFSYLILLVLVTVSVNLNNIAAAKFRGTRASTY